MPLSGAPGISPFLTKTVILSSAELVAFSGGAIDLVEAPGVDQLIWPLSIMLLYEFGTIEYAGAPQLNIRYGASGVNIITNGGFNPVGLGGSAVTYCPVSINSASAALVGPLVGQPTALILSGGGFNTLGIKAASITAAGTGYALGDTGTVTTGNGDATYMITGVGALGVVTSFVITNPGTGYTTGAGQATATGGAQPGVGMSLTIHVTAVGTGDGTIKVVTHYTIIDVP